MTETAADRTGLVLVTGAAGFIGRHVVRALADNGYRVAALQHRTPLPADLTPLCERVVSGDISDPQVRERALDQVHTVCHLSAYIPARMADLGEADHCNRINALGAMELAGAAAQRGVARFIHLSTANMYAQSDSPRTESDLVFPHQLGTAYFVSKLAGEVYVSNIAERTGMTVLILRIASPYGPGEPMAKVIPTFLRLAAAGKPLRMVNGGVARYNYVHVKDVAIIVAKAVNSGSGGIYNVASGEHISVLELGQLIVALQRDGRADLEVDPAEPDAFLGFAPLSIEKTTRTWHFAPHLITDGLRDYHQYLLQRGEI